MGIRERVANVGHCTIHPSRSLMTRLPYCAFVSECVTWMIVVPSSLSFLNSSMISRAWSEWRLPVGSSARIRPGLATTAVVLTVFVIAGVLALIGKRRLAPPDLSKAP